MIQKTVINKPEAIMGRKTGDPTGGTMRRNARWWLSLMALLSMVVGCAAAPSAPVLVFDEHGVFDMITLDYQIELYADGTVRYHGGGEANVIGVRYGKITPEQVQKIIGLYKKVYEKEQRRVADFLKRYEKRFSLDPLRRDELERYKKNYIDRKKWDTSITFNDKGVTTMYGSNGSLMYDFLGILNEMIDIDAWLCYPQSHPQRRYCPVLNHSPNYRLLMERIK